MVIVFLWVFGALSLTFVREGKNFVSLEALILRHHATERGVNNALAIRVYDKIKRPKSGKGDSQKRKNYHSNRDLSPPLDGSKLKLVPLLKHIGSQKEHPLYHLLAQFLSLLYQERLFSKFSSIQKVEYQITDFLLEQKDSLKKEEDLTSIMPKNPELAEIYYRMLRGTSHYSPSEGFPPLLDYLSMQEQALPISLPLASPPLLEALFGKKIKNKILSEEEKRWKEGEKKIYISKDQVREWLSKDSRRPFFFSEIEAYLDTSARLTKKEALIGQDSKTGLVVRKKT